MSAYLICLFWPIESGYAANPPNVSDCLISGLLMGDCPYP